MRFLIIVESFNNSSGGIANKILTQNILTIFPESKAIVGSGDFEPTYNIIKTKRKITFYKLLATFQKVLTQVTKRDYHKILERIFGFSFNFYNDVILLYREVKKENLFDYNHIITLSQGASFRPHYMVLNKLKPFHHKWIANMHDPFPFHQYPRPYNWVIWNYKAQENLMNGIAQCASIVTFPSKELEGWMMSYNEFNKTIIIPHQLDWTINTTITANNEYSELLQVDEFNVLHVGTLLSERHIIDLLEVFLVFSQIHAKTKLWFIGPIAEKHLPILEEYKKSSNGKIDFINKRLAFQDAIYLHKKADVNLIIEANAEISPFLPGKFPHCILANKPILSLSPYYSEVSNILGKEYPYLIEPTDQKKLDVALMQLFQYWKNPSTDDSVCNFNEVKEYLSLSYLEKTLRGLSK